MQTFDLKDCLRQVYAELLLRGFVETPADVFPILEKAFCSGVDPEDFLSFYLALEAGFPFDYLCHIYTEERTIQ